MKNRVITTLMSRAALSAVAGAELRHEMQVATTPAKFGGGRNRSAPGQGDCRIGEHSSLKKRMRAARRGIA